MTILRTHDMSERLVMPDSLSLPTSSQPARLLLCAAAALLAMALTSPSFAQQRGERREAGSHLHGAASMSVAVEGEELTVELETPFYNLIGFERAPQSDAEIAAWMEAARSARDPGRIVALPTSARCRLYRSSLGVLGGDLPAPAKADAQDHADHNHADHDHDDRNGGGDQAFHDALLSWTFRCDSIDKLTELTATALETFPRLTSLDTAYLDAKTQKAQTLTSRSPSLRIR